MPGRDGGKAVQAGAVRRPPRRVVTHAPNPQKRAVHGDCLVVVNTGTTAYDATVGMRRGGKTCVMIREAERLLAAVVDETASLFVSGSSSGGAARPAA